MSETLHHHRPREQFVTTSTDGRAYLWTVADNGDVRGRLDPPPEDDNEQMTTREPRL